MSPPLPKLPAAALRDHGSEATIDQGWRRLEDDLSSGARNSGSSRAALWLAPAAAAALFAAGVFVGSRWLGPGPAPEGAAPIAEAEPERQERQGGTAEEPPMARVVPASSAEAKEVPIPWVRPRLARAARNPAPVPATVPTTDTAAPAAAAPVVVPAWQTLASRGKYTDAYQALEQAGGFDAALERSNAEQLMTLVEVARANRKRGRAIQALRRVVAKYRSDPNAPIAALTLGRLLEAAGDKAGAARAYADYRQLSPNGDFVEDALVREALGAIEQGDVELAQKLADKYDKDFPKGLGGTQIRAALAELEARVPATAADGGAPVPAPGATAGEPAEPEGAKEKPVEG